MVVVSPRAQVLRIERIEKGTHMTEQKKERVRKVKSPLEAELHAAKRVGDMLRDLRPEQRLRVIALVHEHLDQEVSVAKADPRQVDLFQ